MTQEQIKKLAQDDALIMCPKLKGYSWEQQIAHNDAFIRGFQSAQKYMLVEKIKENDVDFISNCQSIKDDIIKNQSNYKIIKKYFSFFFVLLLAMDLIVLSLSDYKPIAILPIIVWIVVVDIIVLKDF